MTRKRQQECFEAIIIWCYSENGYYKNLMTDVAVWLSCYVYIFAISTSLITVN